MGYRLVKMSTELFSLLMTEGVSWPDDRGRGLRVVKGLPEGAKLEAVSHDLRFMFDEITLKYSHPSWPDVVPGEAIPFVDIVFKTEPVATSDTPELADKQPESAMRRFIFPPSGGDTAREFAAEFVSADHRNHEAIESVDNHFSGFVNGVGGTITNSRTGETVRPRPTIIAKEE